MLLLQKNGMRGSDFNTFCKANSYKYAVVHTESISTTISSPDTLVGFDCYIIDSEYPHAGSGVIYIKKGKLSYSSRESGTEEGHGEKTIIKSYNANEYPINRCSRG